ncbi:MAG: hypothetical protein RSA40_03145 [Malacoplasma sp.]
MKKFISTIGYIVFVVVLVIIGIMGIVALTNDTLAGNAGGVTDTADKLTVAGAVAVSLVVGGFGGAIASGFMALANFFKEKTKKIS